MPNVNFNGFSGPVGSYLHMATGKALTPGVALSDAEFGDLVAEYSGIGRDAISISAEEHEANVSAFRRLHPGAGRDEERAAIRSKESGDLDRAWGEVARTMKNAVTTQDRAVRERRESEAMADAIDNAHEYARRLAEFHEAGAKEQLRNEILAIRDANRRNEFVARNRDLFPDVFGE